MHEVSPWVYVAIIGTVTAIMVFAHWRWEDYQQRMRQHSPCPECKGDGRHDIDAYACDTCGGRGYVKNAATSEEMCKITGKHPLDCGCWSCRHTDD